MSIIGVLLELVTFAASRGEDIARTVADFQTARPELVRPGDERAAPARDDAAIDDEIADLIDRGEA
jgi:hypothetical protein